MTHPSSPPSSTHDHLKARRDQLVTDYLNAKSAIDKHETIARQVAEQLIAELGIGGRHEVTPGVGVRVQAPVRRFNPELAHAVLTPDQYSAICEPVPTAKLAEAKLPGLLVDQCKVPDSRPTVQKLR